MQQYINRLIQEWNQHGKIIIAVDWDDTLYPWKFINNDFDRVWKLLLECQITGAYIVIFTACNPDRYLEILNVCNNRELEIASINKTPIELPYGNNGSKIYANIFLDDRAGLEQSLEILEKALYLRRTEQQQILHNYPGSLG